MLRASYTAMSGSKYCQIFDDALAKYTKPDENTRGYSLTIFSKIRHSFSFDEKLSPVREQLLLLDNEELARNFINDYLYSAKKNNHSFACYFIDELIKSDPDFSQHWQSLDPKPIVYLDHVKLQNPYLYRGMRLTANEALNIYMNGLTCKTADLDVLASTHTWDCGISTSKSFEATLAYAAPIITDVQLERALMHGEGWIFEINPAQLTKTTMIDIMATSHARRQKEWERHEYVSWFASVVGGFLANHDEEVNITQQVPATALMRLFRVERTSGSLVKVYNNAKQLEGDVKRAQPSQTQTQRTSRTTI